MPSPNTVPILKRLLKVTLVSRNAFAKAAETVPSADLAEMLVERALEFARIADGLRDQLARSDGTALHQSVEHAQRFVVTVLEARRAYRLAMSDAMRTLMESTPEGVNPEAPLVTDEHTTEHHVRDRVRMLPGTRHMSPARTTRRHLVTPGPVDRPALRLVQRED